MTTLTDLEQKAIADYGAVRAWIALNPMLSALAGLIIGGLLGHFL